MRSKFEEEIARKYPELGYEQDKLTYVVPAKKRTYNPDWTVRDGVFIESKGKLDRETIEKMLLVKEQNPDKKIYILFQKGNNKVRRGSKTTYLDWAKKNGFEAACWQQTRGEIPQEWLTQENNKNE